MKKTNITQITKTQWLLYIGVCEVALVLAGCATPLPNKAFVRCGPTYTSTMPTVDHVGLLVDAVAAYDRVSTNYFDIEDSLVALTNLAHETVADLKGKGYDLAFVESPFVGGFKDPGKDYPVARGRKDNFWPQKAPFQIMGNLDSDGEYRDALLTVSREVLEAVENRGEVPTERLRANESTRKALSVIAAKKGVRYLCVVQGNGTIVSGGKQVGQEIGTVLVSSIISLGMVSVSAHYISLLDSYVSLIDLQTAEVVWCNSLRLGGLNPANPNHYQSLRWAHNVLYWLPPRGKLEPGAK